VILVPIDAGACDVFADQSYVFESFKLELKSIADAATGSLEHLTARPLVDPDVDLPTGTILSWTSKEHPTFQRTLDPPPLANRPL
jgi:hypothetical protein